MNTKPRNRLVIVNRADPVICGHSVEGRNLAEAALERGFDEVRIVTWPIERLEATGLPLKPLDRMLPYSEGHHRRASRARGRLQGARRRYLAGITGRLVELFTDGVPTVCLSLYLSLHTIAVPTPCGPRGAPGCRSMSRPSPRRWGRMSRTSCARAAAEGRFGAAAHVLSSYLAQDHCVAVSEYTRELIVESAAEVDALHGTSFAAQCQARVGISYPAIDSSPYLDPRRRSRSTGCSRRWGSRVDRLRAVPLAARAGQRRRRPHPRIRAQQRPRGGGIVLVIVGRGPEADELRAQAAESLMAASLIDFLDDVGDAEKPYLMAGCAAFVLPSKPRPEFVETFGIALAEQMLAGGGAVITTDTGGIGEAVGDHAFIVPVDDPDAIAAAIDTALALTPEERTARAERARAHALQFDRGVVFERLFDGAGVLPARMPA